MLYFPKMCINQIKLATSMQRSQNFTYNQTRGYSTDERSANCSASKLRQPAAVEAPFAEATISR